MKRLKYNIFKHILVPIPLTGGAIARAVNVHRCIGCKEFGPQNLIDSNEDTIYRSNNLQTSRRPEDRRRELWIQLELGLVSVDRVDIKNRKDCCGDRTSAVEVSVGWAPIHETDTPEFQTNNIDRGVLCGHFPGKGTNGELMVIPCEFGIPGSMVNVVIKDPNVHEMNIAEIYVYGTSMKIRIINYNIL